MLRRVLGSARQQTISPPFRGLAQSRAGVSRDELFHVGQREMQELAETENHRESDGRSFLRSHHPNEKVFQIPSHDRGAEVLLGEEEPRPRLLRSLPGRLPRQGHSGEERGLVGEARRRGLGVLRRNRESGEKLFTVCLALSMSGSSKLTKVTGESVSSELLLY